MVATRGPRGSRLDGVGRVIDGRSELMSAVFLLDDSGKALTYAVGPHLPDVWRRVVSAAPLPVTAAGACGTAATRRAQIVAPHLPGHPTHQPLREAARPAGIQAARPNPSYAPVHRAPRTFAVSTPAL